MRTAAPGNSHGTLKARNCFVCTKKRNTLMFRGPMYGRTGFVDKTIKVPVCEECIRSTYGTDRVESEIAMGRLSFKSRRPPTTAVQEALPLTEEI